MSLPDFETRHAWKERFLGIKLPIDKAGESREKPEPALPVWREAKEKADTQISQLLEAMRRTERSLLTRIADLGLHGITGRLQVTLHVDLLAADRADAETREAAARKAAASARSLRDFLAADPVVRLIDANPLGVPVGLRSGLSEALQRVESLLSA